jgi:hypothetical protein
LPSNIISILYPFEMNFAILSIFKETESQNNSMNKLNLMNNLVQSAAEITHLLSFNQPNNPMRSMFVLLGGLR